MTDENRLTSMLSKTRKNNLPPFTTLSRIVKSALEIADENDTCYQAFIKWYQQGISPHPTSTHHPEEEPEENKQIMALEALLNALRSYDGAKQLIELMTLEIAIAENAYVIDQTFVADNILLWNEVMQQQLPLNLANVTFNKINASISNNTKNKTLGPGPAYTHSINLSEEDIAPTPILVPMPALQFENFSACYIANTQFKQCKADKMVFSHAQDRGIYFENCEINQLTLTPNNTLKEKNHYSAIKLDNCTIPTIAAQGIQTKEFISVNSKVDHYLFQEKTYRSSALSSQLKIAAKIKKLSIENAAIQTLNLANSQIYQSTFKYLRINTLNLRARAGKKIVKIQDLGAVSFNKVMVNHFNYKDNFDLYTLNYEWPKKLLSKISLHKKDKNLFLSGFKYHLDTLLEDQTFDIEKSLQLFNQYSIVLNNPRYSLWHKAVNFFKHPFVEENTYSYNAALMLYKDAIATAFQKNKLPINTTYILHLEKLQEILNKEFSQPKVNQTIQLWGDKGLKIIPLAPLAQKTNFSSPTLRLIKNSIATQIIRSSNRGCNGH